MFLTTAVQHERAPKVSGVTSSSHGLSYAASAFSRHQEGFFPFQMHFPTPLDGYSHYLPPVASIYYPHLTESLNLKLNQGIYKPQMLAPRADYDLEIGKMLTNNLFPRAGAVDVPKNSDNSAKERENEVTSSAELPLLTSNDSSRLKSTQSLYDSATKLLFLSIRWAKSIPSFNHLPFNDQKTLLSETWAELFVIAASQWGLLLDAKIISDTPSLTDLQNVIKHFVELKVDHFEAACLKALILFRGDSRSTVDQTTLQQTSLLQNQTLCLLMEKCGGLRFGHLLLLLPQIRIAGSIQNLQVFLA